MHEHKNSSGPAAADEGMPGSTCPVCNRLWKRFQGLSGDLVKLVQAKRTGKLAEVLQYNDIRRITADRHQAKENILAHGQVCAIRYALQPSLQ